MVSADPARWTPVLFPGWVKGSAPDEAEEISEDEDLSDTTGTWVFEDVGVTPEDAKRALEEMLRNPGGVLSLEDFTGQEFGDWQG